MSETVTVTPQYGLDANDDPITAPSGASGASGSTGAVNLTALVAPGNTTVKPGADGQLDTVAFTVYLPLKVQVSGQWVRTSSVLTDNFTITVRGQVCLGRAKEWDLNGRGGIEVLATALTGATP